MKHPRNGRRLAAAVLAAASLSVLFAGCSIGGESEPATKDEVQQAVVTARNRTDFAFERMTNAEGIDDLLERMQEASDNIGDAASELDDVNVPDPYAEETDRLVGALDQLSVDLEATASDLQRPEVVGDLLSGTRGINFDSWDEANRALAALIGLGIEVDLLQRHTRDDDAEAP